MTIIEAIKNSIKLVNMATPHAKTPAERTILMETQKALFKHLTFLNKENEIHSKSVHGEMPMFNFTKEDLVQMNAYYSNTSDEDDKE